MPYLSKKRVWTQQPQQWPLRIKQSDPITKGLRIALVGTSGLNIADGIMLTKMGTVDQAITPHGVAHQPLVNSVAGWQYDQEISGAVSIHTIIARAADTATGDANKVQAVVSNNTSGQSPRWEFNLGNGFGPGADKNKPRFSTDVVGIGSIYYNGVLQSGNNPAAVALSNNVFYGITAVAASGASASGSGKTNLFTLQTAYSLNGYCPLILVWDRALNANEISRIAANPWLVFIRENSRIWIPSAGGGSSTNLIIQDSTHSLLSDNLDLSTSLLLTIQDSTHSLTSDNLILNTTGSTDLIIQEATHSLTSDNLLITTEWLLDIASAAHALTSDSLDLSTALSIIIQNAIHSHTADNLVLDTSNTTLLTIQDAVHNHTADNLDLTLDTWLVIANAVHSHLADNIDLGTELTLTIQDSTHNLTSDIIILSIPSTGSCPTVEEIVAAIMIQIEAKNYLTLPQFLSFK